MRTSRFFITVSLLFLSLCAKGQNNWDEYEIGKIFKLSVPSTITLRDPDSVIGKVMDNAVNKFTLQYGGTTADWKYTFVPKEGTTATRYARVIVAVNRQNDLTQKMIKEATAADLQDLKDSRIEGAKQMGMTIKNLTVKKEVYDGMYTLVIRCDRPGTSGDVHVEEYMFFLLNKQIDVTISYRISEASIWKKDFSAIPSTFSFE